MRDMCGDAISKPTCRVYAPCCRDIELHTGSQCADADIWNGPRRDASVINAPGHVGLFAGLEGEHLFILGGGQSDSVTVSRFSKTQGLGVRRLL